MTQTVWVIDDDASIRWVLGKALTQASITHELFASIAAAKAALAATTPALIVSDIRLPNENGLDFLAQLKIDLPSLPVVIMTAYGDLDSAVSAYQRGAFEYLAKPFDLDAAIALIRRALSQNALPIPKKPSAVKTDKVAASAAAQGLGGLLGQAPAMQMVFRAIGKLSQSNATVLVTGETGTGKELVARALHQSSSRKAKPFIALNTAAIPRDLLESELFGHEKGAFTGAAGQRQGRFEQAQGGTLFLDEIGDMPAELQTRLLRVLSDGHFYRVGGTQSIKSDVRIVAATHQDLPQRVKQGLFREDLYHRLNVIALELPPLRARSEDIGLLAGHFLTQAAKQAGLSAKQLDISALAVLQAAPFAGNVRELENLCQWLTIMAPSDTISAADLPASYSDIKPATINQPPNQAAAQALSQAPAEAVVAQTSIDNSAVNNQSWQSLIYGEIAAALKTEQNNIIDVMYAELEKVAITAALAHTKGRRAKAAVRLGLGRNTLTRKADELGIKEE